MRLLQYGAMRISLAPGDFQLQSAWISRPAGIFNLGHFFCQRSIHMPDMPRPCIAHPELVRFKYRLPHLARALKSQRKIRIVAIGSSSTAGEGEIVPYPARLQIALRKQFPDRMIDVLNRGIGGQEAPSELSRFESDVVAETPTLVIWQVGTNAVFRKDQFNLEEVGRSIATGLGWLDGL